jgi:predicted esterase
VPGVRSFGALVVLVALSGCEGVISSLDSGRAADASIPDAGLADAGLLDSGVVDAGEPEVDAGTVDSGVVDAGAPFDAGFADAGVFIDAGAPFDAGLPVLTPGDAGVACNPAVHPTPNVQTLIPLGGNCSPQGYAEYVPAGYPGNQLWPAIIFFHGNGQWGSGSASDIQLVDDDGLPAMVAANTWDPQHRFLVLSPQMAQSERSAERVRAFVAFAKANYAIDPHRLYFTGLSGGGECMYNYLDLFKGADIAAVAPISGWYEFRNAECSWAHVPLWYFHGNSDGTVPVGHSQISYDNLMGCQPPPNPAPLFTKWDNVGHTGWNHVYDSTWMNGAQAIVAGSTPFNVTLYDWLLTHSR